MKEYTEKDSYVQIEEELKKEINDQFGLAKRYLDPVHQRFNEIEELYRSYINAQDYPHNAKVFDPRVFRIIETVTPRMAANEPTGSFYPSEQGDIATAQVLNSLMKYDWRRAEMFPKLVTLIKSLLIFGTAFGRTHWDFREVDRQRMVPKEVSGRMVWSPKEKEIIKVTEFDGPNFEPLNIYDCFPDPNCTSIHNMRWFIYRTFKTLKELKQENETRGTDYYKNIDQLEQKLEGNETDNTSPSASRSDLQYREHRRVMLSTQELLGEDKSNPDIVVLRRFTREGWCDYLPEHDLIIREVENPYFHGDLPIIHAVDYIYPGELYGMGEIEPLERIQRAINAVLNQRLDNVQLVLRNMWKVKKGAGVDMHTLISAPGNIITTDNMDAVMPIDVPDVTGPTFTNTMNYLTGALQNGSGITDYTQGINTGANTNNDTATGIRLIQNEANAQFKLKIQLFSHMVIQRIANQWKDMRIQYTTDQQVIRIVGKDIVKYLKENTQLAQTSVDGQPILPGEDTQSKLQIQPDSNFAFLTILPEDIKPSIVGDYDFIANVSSEQLMDPIAMQQNYMEAIKVVNNPLWIKGLAAQNKQLNYVGMTAGIFDKLNIGLEEKDVVTEMAPPQPAMPQNPQPTMPAGNPNPIPAPPQPAMPLTNPQDITQMMGGQNAG